MTYHFAIGVGLVISVIGGGLIVSYPVAAQQSQLQQQILPIECVYTTAYTGLESGTTSTCDDQPLPTVTKVLVNEGYSVIIGHFSALKTQLLRVWLNEHWYTLGVDARLSAVGDTWVLDLSHMDVPLEAGQYRIMLEASTGGGFLLHNIDAAIFTVSPLAHEPDHAGGRAPISVNPRLVVPPIVSGNHEFSNPPVFSGRTPLIVDHTPKVDDTPRHFAPVVVAAGSILILLVVVGLILLIVH